MTTNHTLKGRPLGWRYCDPGRHLGAVRLFHQGDCVVRALCTATGVPYDKVRENLLANARPRAQRKLNKELGLVMAASPAAARVLDQLTRDPLDGACLATFAAFLEEHGFRMLAFDWGDDRDDDYVHVPGRRPRLNADDVPTSGIVLPVTDDHITVVKDGVILDQYDCGQDQPELIAMFYKACV